MWPWWLAGAALGVAAEWSLYGWSRPGLWLPDLLTGWCLIGCGLAGWSRRPASWSGALLAATGFAWFVPNFATTGIGAVDWLSAHALYLHRGPLAAVVLTYPRGRPAGRLDAVAVVVLCAVAVITPVWRNDVTAIALAAAMVGVAARGYPGASGRERRMRFLALQATSLVGVTIAVTALLRLGLQGRPAVTATLHGYELMLGVLAVGLLIGLVRTPWERAEVTDLVVELGDSRSATLRDALARSLGDPSLEVGFWLPESGRYVDSGGHPLQMPAPDSRRSATVIDRDGQPLAVLLHDPAVLEDEGLIQAVASAARLAAANARLQAELRARVAEVAASRRRILEAGDEERGRLERRLREGAQRRLDELARLLARARESARASGTIESISKSQSQLARTQSELTRLARGIRPRELAEEGVGAALRALAQEFPLPVELTISNIDAAPAVEACAYFVCSEALANVAKYASASSVRITVSSDASQVTVGVGDDGTGGADPNRGTGLRGLADRVAALGGTLTVESPAGAGTRLIAQLPCDGG